MPNLEERQRLSVVMPVHNALPHLDAAVRSILDQSWADFEFVILDDASTDGSAERLRQWAAQDDRIRLVRVEENLGPAGSSNAVVRLARGELIARMDADDISHPLRLERQMETLARNPDVGLVGVAHALIDTAGRPLREPNYWRLFHASWFVPFAHGSILYRRSLFEQAGGYREQCVFWEDQDFFIRASAFTRILTLVEPLYLHRQSEVSTRLASERERVEQAVDRMYRSVRCLEQGRSYDRLLDGPAASGKVDPRVFVALGSLILWSGKTPKLVRSILSRGRLGFDGASLGALGWTFWARVWPGGLRLFLKLVARMKNRSVRAKLGGFGAVEWRTPSDAGRLPAGDGRTTDAPGSLLR